MKNFQTILLIVFGVFIAAGMAIFSGFIPTGKSAAEQQLFSGELIIWGTFPSGYFKPYFEPLTQEYDGLVLKYVSKKRVHITKSLSKLSLLVLGLTSFH